MERGREMETERDNEAERGRETETDGERDIHPLLYSIEHLTYKWEAQYFQRKLFDLPGGQSREATSEDNYVCFHT